MLLEIVNILFILILIIITTIGFNFIIFQFRSIFDNVKLKKIENIIYYNKYYFNSS